MSNQLMRDKPLTLLKTATEIFEHQNIMTFVGNPGSGKTVLGTLLKDAIYAHFMRLHGHEYGFNLIKGSDILEENEQYIFEKKIFPPETAPDTQSELKFEMIRKSPMSSKIITQIRDLSEEDFKKVFLGGDLEPKTRVNNILTDKEKIEQYGPLSFLIFAKLYVIVLDCAEFSRWRIIDTRYEQMLNSILGFKKVIGETNGKKFTTPLAIVLTKTDTLEKPIEDSAEEMVKKNLSEFYRTLNTIHAGERQFFTFFIESEKSNKVKPYNFDQNGNIPENTEQNGNTLSGIEIMSLKKLKDPINYSDVEYVKFILWLLKIM